MIKSYEKWCVFNKNGDILNWTISNDRSSAIQKILEDTKLLDWSEALKIGYFCDPVMITTLNNKH